MSDTKIKENSLNEEMAQTAIMFLRLVTSKLTGDSKLIQIQNLILQISNIYGLQTIIDGLQTLVTGSESEIPIFDALGQIESSNFKIGTFDTIESLDLCTQQGLYTASDVVDVPIVGDVQFSFVVLGHRLLFGSNGLWHCVYSSSWSLPRYVGGAFDNITIPYADAVDLATNGQLSPGAAYKITGIGQDEGLILRAASADTFETDGIRLGLVPAHFDVGTFDSVVWKGAWRSTGTYAEDDHVIRYGRVFRNLTGSTGTEDGFGLDSMNWLPIDPLIGVNEGFYVREVFGCTYRLVSNLPLVFTTGYVSRQWDSRGNSFGIEVEPADGFKVEYNDFGNVFIYGNILKSCYNNISASGSEIYNNNGDGDIHDNDSSKIYECILTDENNNIRYNGGYTIYKNTLVGTADIDSNQTTTNSTIQYCTVEGDIKANTDVSVNNTEIDLNGKVKDCVELTVSDSQINGLYEDNVRINFLRSILKQGARYGKKGSLTAKNITDSVLYSDNYSTETITADIYTREDLIPLTDDSITGGSSTKKFKNWFTKILSTFTIDSLGEDLTIKTGTAKTLKLDTTVYDDVNMAIASAKVPPSNTPTWSTFTANTNAYTFAIDNYADLGTIEIPHTYKEGTDLEIHLHLATNGLNNATARKVKYILYYTYGIPDNGTNQFIAESSLTAELTIPANQADKSVYYLSMGTIAGTNIKIGTQFKCRIKRIAGTGTEPINDPFLGQVGIHFHKDTLGSRSISTK